MLWKSKSKGSTENITCCKNKSKRDLIISCLKLLLRHSIKKLNIYTRWKGKQNKKDYFKS